MILSMFVSHFLQIKWRKEHLYGAMPFNVARLSFSSALTREIVLFLKK